MVCCNCRHLRISAATSLLPWLDAFQQEHPQLNVRLLLGDRIADLFRQPVDIALRYGEPEDSSLIALPIAPDNIRVLCAAPSYLARHGEPRHLEQLAQHNCLLYMLGSRVHDHWGFYDGKRHVSLTVSGDRFSDDADVVRRWAVAGMGIAYKSWAGCEHRCVGRALAFDPAGTAGRAHPAQLAVRPPCAIE